MRRWMMAAAASMMAVVLFLAAHLLGLLGIEAFVTAALLTVGFIVLFYAMFRSGLNLRFRDASLTVPQIVAASMVILYALSRSKDGQSILALIYVVSFLFGVFRLSTRELLALTAFVSFSYALIIGLYWYPEAGSDPVAFKRTVLNWIVLTVVLAFCSVLGGYVSKLRKNLTERRVLLEVALQRIEHMAARDELTDLLNRRSLTEFLARQKGRADRFGIAFSVLMLDQ